MPSELGKLLRKARRKREIGLRQLARMIKKSPALLTRLENEDEVPAISPETLAAIAEAVGLPVDQVLVLAKRSPQELSPRTELEFALYRRVKGLRVAEQQELLKKLRRTDDQKR